MSRLAFEQASRSICGPKGGLSYYDALSTLNTLQAGANAFRDENRLKLTPRERTLAWLEYLKLDASTSAKITLIH